MKKRKGKMSVEWEAESTGYYFFLFRAIFINESCLAATSLGLLGFQLLWEMLPIIFSLLCSIIDETHHLGTCYYINFLGRLGSNGFQLK